MVRPYLDTVRGFRLSARSAISLASASAWLVDSAAARPWSRTLPWGVLLLMLALGIRDVRATRGARAEAREVELGVTLGIIVAVGSLLLTEPFAAVARGSVFALVTLSAVLGTRASGLAFTLVAAGVNLCLLLNRGRALTLGEVAFVTALPVWFLVTSLAVHHVVQRAQTATRHLVEDELDRIRETARSYRLGGFDASSTDVERTSAVSRSHELPQLVTSSIEHLHASLEFVLRLLGRTLHLRTVALLWIEDHASEQIAVREIISDVKDLVRGPFDVHEGIVAAALTTRQLVVIEAQKARGRMPLYAAEQEPTQIYAVPLLEGQNVVGVLLVDVRAAQTHTPAARLLQEAADFVLRAIQAERLLLQTERSKTQQRKLYQAAEALAKARTENEVIRAGVDSARRFTSFDFAAVTLYHAAEGMHEICAVSGPEADALVGSVFQDNGGLVSLVVDCRHSLPFRGEFFPEQQIVFAEELPAPAMASLLILPLLVHEEALGTLILGSRLPGTLGEEVRPTLEVLAQQVAVSLANARMVKRLGELATTDGMTGHLNKRALIETAQQKICSAARFSKPLSVIIGDIDLFKRVNDTYGHDVGDIVIRGFGAVLRRTKRETDAVGRFGGEEFVLVCEETDATGARLLAERIRQELAATVFHTEQGPLQVTCSLGVATMPVAGCDWEQMFKSSDEALYAAKRGGRNRVSVWAPGLRAAVA